MGDNPPGGSRDGSEGKSGKGQESLRDLLVDYGRGLAGGLLFGLPLLFTAEIWRQAFLMNPLRLVGFLTLQILVLMGFVWVSGFKREQEKTLLDISLEAGQTFGLALVESALILYLIGQIAVGMAPMEIVGKIILEAIPVSVGISIATSQMQAHQGKRQGRDKEGKSSPQERWKIARQYVKVVGGAFYMGYNFAPISDVTLVVRAAGWGRLLGIMALSLVVTYGLVFALDVKGGTRSIREPGLLDRPWSETVTAYAVSLIVAVLLLFFFKAIDFNSANTVIEHTVVLGLPCSMGAAAGRLLI